VVCDLNAAAGFRRGAASFFGNDLVLTIGLPLVAGLSLREFAGVVAHELAHVTQKHGFRKIISSAGPYLIFKVFLGNSAGVLPILGDSSELLIRQSFSQEYELEADDVGWQSLVNARIDPRGLADMLRKLQLEQRRMHAGMGQVNAFSSHPATAKRLQRLDAKWNKLKDKSSFVQL